MWRGLPILALATLVGCACKPPPATQPVVIHYSERPAAALAFVPPATTGSSDGPTLDLSRRGREPAAMVGYDSGGVEFYWQRTDDRVRFFLGRNGSSGGGWSNDRYERRSVSTRVGVLYR